MLTIDWETIEFEFSDEMDIFFEIYQDYCHSYLKMAEDIKRHLDDGDYKQSMIAAHTLKGVVSNFYCEKIRKVALEIETKIKDEDTSNIAYLLDSYNDLHNELTLEFDSYFKKKSIIKRAS